MEKRYFTSDLSSLSYASLTFWIGMTSTSAVMLCWPQKSSISWVSGMPPMGDPEKLRRLKISPKTETGSGFVGRADHGNVAVAAEQVDIRVNVVVGGNGVEDEIEAAGVLLHFIGVAGDDHFIGAQAARVVLLVR